jgi:DNA uptake protein ComE-like DNA-binding protein
MSRIGGVFSNVVAVVALLFAIELQAAPVTVTTPPPAQTPPAATAPSASAPAAAKLDINSATAEQLATLEGIGKIRSAAIVSGRPYLRKDELVKRKILPAAVYARIKDQIIASQS